MDLTLYHYWRSSCSWRVRWGFALKGVPYKSVPVNILAGEQREAAYLAKNPSGYLPALQVDDADGQRFFGESLAILEWLEEAHPTPALLPKAPLERLHVRQLALTIATGTQPLQNPAALKRMSTDETARKGHAQFFIAQGLQTFETLLDKRPETTYAGGDHVTFADLCLVPQVYNALRFDVDLAKTPRIRGIYERCLATKECAESHPSRQPGAS